MTSTPLRKHVNRQIEFSIRVPDEMYLFIKRFQADQEIKGQAEAARQLLAIAQAATEL